MVRTQGRLTLGLTCVLTMAIGAVAQAGDKVPAQHDIAAKWERNLTDFSYKHATDQRPYVASFASKYYVTTSKRTGQTKVRQSRTPFRLNPKRQKVVHTLLPAGNGYAQQVALPVDAATAIRATEMANTLWNGSYGHDKAGKPTRVPSTPGMAVLPYLGKGVQVVQVRSGDYHNNIAPKYLVTGLKPNSKGVAGLRVRLLLPTSSHDGGTVEGGRTNALKYAGVDQFRIWQTDPGSSGHAKRQLKVLADAIPSNGQLVTPVDMVLHLKKGQLFQMQMDPLPGRTAGPGGFYSGRTAEFEWVDQATFKKALAQ